jgi:ArsR family transcriptional regulator
MGGDLQRLQALFQALGDTTRLRILGLLLAGDVCVCDIHESLEVSQPKASRHLAFLRRCGLVETRRDGLWVHYRLARPRDVVVATVLDAVRHALTHVEAVRKDAARLQKRTGCGIPEIPAGTSTCCVTADEVAAGESATARHREPRSAAENDGVVSRDVPQTAPSRRARRTSAVADRVPSTTSRPA